MHIYRKIENFSPIGIDMDKCKLCKRRPRLNTRYDFCNVCLHIECRFCGKCSLNILEILDGRICNVCIITKQKY